MKREVMIGALLALSAGLMAATPKAAKPAKSAVAVASAEATPEVKTSDAPEVTDPDLKEAMPAMRQGTDEPLGGFKDAGMKGRSAVAYSWGIGNGFVEHMLGWRYWMHDRAALQVGLGGTYREIDLRTFESALAEEVGLRFALTPTQAPAFVYFELKGAARQGSYHSESQVLFPTYTQYTRFENLDQSYNLAARVGAELFWPGSRRVSLDVAGGLLATWTRMQNLTIQDSNDPVLGTKSRVETQGQGFGLRSEYGNLLLAVNLYY